MNPETLGGPIHLFPQQAKVQTDDLQMCGWQTCCICELSSCVCGLFTGPAMYRSAMEGKKRCCGFYIVGESKKIGGWCDFFYLSGFSKAHRRVCHPTYIKRVA